tara:strand:+ start:515 stop:694 length:180 start_codon:yes stop_codon:yes gene_type:complete
MRKEMEDMSVMDLESRISTLEFEVQKAEGQISHSAHRLKICAGELYHAQVLLNNKNKEE